MYCWAGRLELELRMLKEAAFLPVCGRCSLYCNILSVFRCERFLRPFFFFNSSRKITERRLDFEVGRILIECRITKTKVVTTANQWKGKKSPGANENTVTHVRESTSDQVAIGFNFECDWL